MQAQKCGTCEKRLCGCLQVAGLGVGKQGVAAAGGGGYFLLDLQANELGCELVGGLSQGGAQGIQCAVAGG